jgi:hypothetical protein
MEMTEEVTPEAVEAAWAFVSFSMDSVEKLVKDAASESGSTRADKSPQEMIRDVLKRYGGETKASDLLRALWGKLNAAGIKAAVEEMDDVEVIQEKTGKRGAPRQIYRLIDAEDQDQDQEQEQEHEKPTLRVVSFEAAKPKPKQAPAPVSSNPFLNALHL